MRLPRGVANIIAAIGFTGLSVLAGFTLSEQTSPAKRLPPTPRFAAITADLQDVDIHRAPDGTARIVRAAHPRDGAAPAAPLMDWEDRNVREGNTLVWCMADADAEAADVMRGILDRLTARFPPAGQSGIRWREDCGGATYSLGADAYDQCGIGDGAVACAGPTHYCGQTVAGDAWCGGRVTYNGHYREYTTSGGRRGIAPGLDRAGLVTALAHEVQHLLLNLGHNACGIVTDPATGQPVPSVMTAVNLPSGPSCSRPAAADLAPADWTYALSYYTFGAIVAPPATTTPDPGVGVPAHPTRAVRTGDGRTAAVFTAYRLDVVGAIAGEADRTGLPPLWVLAMGAQEGGLACPPTCPVGDLDLNALGSCGTFQIYRAVHGGTCEQWQNPVNAMRLMDARWKWAYARAGGGDAFLADPHAFLIESIPNAQGSIGWNREIASGAFRVALVSYIELLQSRAVAAGDGAAADQMAALLIAASGLDDIALRAAVQAEQLRRTAEGR